MPDNSRVFKIFDKVLELVDNPKEVKELEFSWFSNGPSGFRHAIKNCSELKVTSVLVEHSLTVDNAGTNRICATCFRNIIPTVSPHGRVFVNFLNNYLELADTSAKLSIKNLNSYKLDILFTSLSSIIRIKISQDELVKIDGFASDHSRAVKVFNETYTQFTENVTKSIISRKDEVFAEVAVQSLNSIIRSNRAGGFIKAGTTEDESTAVNETLGNSGIRQSNVLALYTAWTSIKLDPLKSEKELENIYSKFSLTDLSQLKHVKTDKVTLSQSNGIESALEYATSCWQKTKDELSVSVLEFWENELQRITSSNNMVSLAIDTSLLSYVTSDLIPKLRLISMHAEVDETKMLLILPMYVASYIEDDTPHRHGVAASPVQIHSSVLPLEIAETALNLWNPRDGSGAYTSFTECVSSATALMR